MTAKEEKLKAFEEFPFQNNDEWKAYISTIEIVTTGHDAALRKLKAKWYKRVVDSDFEVEWVTAAKAGTYTPPPPPPPRAQPSASSGYSSGSQQQQQQYAQYRPSTGAYGQNLFGPLPGHDDASTQGLRLAMLHGALLVLGVVAAIPFLPINNLAYTLFMRMAAGTLAYKLYLLHGLPKFRPWSMVMDWLQRVAPSPELHFLLVCLSFMAQPPIMMVVMPMWITSAYHVVGYASRVWRGRALWERYGARLHHAMTINQENAVLASVACEIAVAFLLVVMLLVGPRNIVLTFMYWNLLKTRYHFPSSAAQHRKVWSLLDAKVAPYLNAVPAANQVLGYAKRWFTTMPQPRR